MTLSDGTELFPRYRDRISDWDALEAACRRPLPIVLRVNTLRTNPHALRARLAQQGVRAEPLRWDENLLRADRPVGRTIEHWLGHFYIQEASQTVPVTVLDSRPGERVLDMCAAPGGKTTHLAACMENRGTLVSNEPNGRRAQALLANINRLGALNATVTEYRGESFPRSSHFDRILLDAPCSAEGTVRKERRLRPGAPPASIRRLSRLQLRLITVAYDLLRPGGILVYSTCTLAPEENEQVVARLLETRDARLLPISTPFETSRGWTEWEGVTWPSAMAHCIRLYPHHLDSGGGFVARIERPA
jgi:NOL1/NOP2/sun family putative RNA methylase